MSRRPTLELAQSSEAWGTTRFEDVLKDELEGLSIADLPLQQGLSGSSYVAGSGFSVTILSVSDQRESIRAKVGVFYLGIIAGCSCADDPTPLEEQTEYCELQLDIEKNIGATTVTLLVR